MPIVDCQVGMSEAIALRVEKCLEIAIRWNVARTRIRKRAVEQFPQLDKRIEILSSRIALNTASGGVCGHAPLLGPGPDMRWRRKVIDGPLWASVYRVYEIQCRVVRHLQKAWDVRLKRHWS